MKKNIALLAGGYSGEYEISIKTAITIANHLDPNLYQVYKIIVTKEFIEGKENIHYEYHVEKQVSNL